MLISSTANTRKLYQCVIILLIENLYSVNKILIFQQLILFLEKSIYENQNYYF